MSKNGCYIKYPPENTKVVGVIHFIGGAFAGAAPQVMYRFFLENLSLYGYVVVATPFSMQLDYLKICDEVVSKFDSVAVELAKEVGAVPVIGVGHSLGRHTCTRARCDQNGHIYLFRSLRPNACIFVFELICS